MDPIAPLVTALHSQGRLRVWSLVITVFGDLVQHRGGAISSTRLRTILGRVGVEQGALRTALSRLASDGWLTSERNGRSSVYRLTPEGIEKFAPATSRIYAPPRTEPVTAWAAVVTLSPRGGTDIKICPIEEAGQASDCRVVGTLDQVSDAFRASMLEPAHRSALKTLVADLEALQHPVDIPLDAAAARMLLIHRWRRIALRFTDCPPELMPDDTPLANPRAAVAETYLGLSELAEQWLDTEDTGLDAMPNPAQPAAKRFAATVRG